MSPIGICFTFLLIFAASAALTAETAKPLVKLGFRKVSPCESRGTVVSGGGIAIVVAFVLCGYLCNGFGEGGILQLLNGIMPALLILLMVGIAGDRTEIPIYLAEALQVSALIVFWFGGFQINQLLGRPLSSYSSLAATILWGIGLLNAFRLLDYSDVFCAGNALVCSMTVGGMAFMTNNVAALAFSILLAGSCIGFFFFNIHPPQLALGDTGSLFLGLICTMLSLLITDGDFSFCNIAAMVMLFGIPLGGLCLTGYRRKVKEASREVDGKELKQNKFHIHKSISDSSPRYCPPVYIMWIGILTVNACAIVIFWNNLRR